METAPNSTEWVRGAMDRYEGKLVRYAMRFTRNLEAARDVVQDTFLRLCRAERHKVDDHLAAWLYTVCRNRCLEVHRKDKRLQLTEDEILHQHPTNEPTPGAVLEREELTGAVWGFVGDLPDNQRECIRLKFQDGLSYKEISQITGLSVGNVGYLLHVAVQKLRDELKAEGGMKTLTGAKHED